MDFGVIGFLVGCATLSYCLIAAGGDLINAWQKWRKGKSRL